MFLKKPPTKIVALHALRCSRRARKAKQNLGHGEAIRSCAATLVKPLSDNTPPGYRRANKAGHCGHAVPISAPFYFLDRCSSFNSRDYYKLGYIFQYRDINGIIKKLARVT